MERNPSNVVLYDTLKQQIEDKGNVSLSAENNIKTENTKLEITKIGIIGRPNTGKSTLINNLVGQKRLVTGVEAGITRDSIEVLWNYNNELISIIDTAGLRKKSKVINILEKPFIIFSQTA